MIFRFLGKKTIKRVLKRFIRNAPANRYEQILFNAVRSLASVFGEGEAQPA